MALRRGALVAAALLALPPVRSAGAQTSGEQAAAAEVLFEQGRKLMAQGKYEAACPKFAESHRIDPGVGVLLFLGDCYEKNGQTASAWATFRAAVPLARAAGQEERVRAATERSAALDARLSKLEIAVSEPADNVVVLRDGMEVARSLWGTAVAVDPGRRTIEARAPGRQSFLVTVDVPPGPTLVRVEVPVLAPDSTVEAVVERPRNAETSLMTRDDRAAAKRPDRTLAWVAGSIGLAGVAVGTGFGLAAISAWSDVKQLCPGTPRRCDNAGFERADTAEAYATASTIAFALGAAGIGTAIALWVAAPEGVARRSGAIIGATGRF